MLFSRRESNFVGYFKQAIGQSYPLKPKKVTLFTMIVQFRKNICDVQPFCRTLLFFTAVLWSMLHLIVAKLLMSLAYQLLLKSLCP